MREGPAYLTHEEFLELVYEVWLGLTELAHEKWDGKHHVEDLASSYVTAVNAVSTTLDVLQFRHGKAEQA